MSEFSLYGGPSLQTAKADPGVAARAANGDQGQVLGASVQKAEEAVQGSAEAFARISDFGEMQRQEVELRRIRDESDAKFPRRLVLNFLLEAAPRQHELQKKSSSRKGENALAITPNCILPIQRISRDSSLSVFLFSNL